MPTTYAIIKGNQYMDATTFTATGTTQSVTNAGGFKPDLVWAKQRNATNDNYLNDSVRGAANYLVSNSTGAEVSASQYLTAFNSNGFTMGTSNYSNGSSVVGWQWQAGQGSTSSNTSGSITSTVSANTTAGFSIVSFNTTSASGTSTIGHGLGVAPSMIIMKDRNTAYNWDFWSNGLGSIGNTLILNSTAAVSTTRQPFTTTAPTSSVFSFNNAFYTVPSDNVIAYCWSEVAGFSKFGSYTGNANADGPFIYTGFRPKYIMLKNASNAAYGWTIWDTTRNPSNVVNLYLQANGSVAEDTFTSLDALSNGFKMRTSSDSLNQSGATIIYTAFAETPFKYANAR